MSERQFDVAIVGGGLVGAAVALQLVACARIRPDRIVVIEPSPPEAPRVGSPMQLRVSAISPVNRTRLRYLGAWQGLDAARIAAYERMVVWHESVPADSPDVLRFDAAEAGERDLGCIVENVALQSALLQTCERQGVVILKDSLQQLVASAGGVELSLADSRILAELVVGADGAASSVRRMLGLPAGQHDYGQRAIVATVHTSRPHRSTAWQRFLATGPLALLPLPGNAVSIVWSATDARAAELLALAPEEFSAQLTAASANVLGTLTVQGERAAFPLRRLAAQRYVQPRVALVGDAAHVIHPLAGQGVNQGLEDAAALAAALASRPPRESAGALAALRRYERERRAGNALVGGVVDGIDRLFTRPDGLLAWAARAGMAQVARSSVARGLIVRQAVTGRSWPRR